MRSHAFLTVVALTCPLLPVMGCADDGGPSATSVTFGGNDSTTGRPDDDTSSTGRPDDTGETVADASAEGTSTGTGIVDDSGTTSGSSSEGSEGSSTGEPVEACLQQDDPDINGLDENMDGLDGLAGCSVFVNVAVGSDINSGLASDDPVGTIARGIEIAASFSPPRPVLVAEGTYNETVNLDSGVSLFGGYDDQSWERDVYLNETIIAGTEFRSLVAINLSEEVEVDGFTIRGASYTEDSQSTYAVWVRDTPEGLLLIDYCTIEAGDAGHGNDGQNGTSGEDGGNGSNGNTNGNAGPGGISGCGATGGNGGNGTACPSSGGTNGAAGGDPTNVGTGGAAGASVCGSDCDDEGTNASPGISGGVGVNGLGGSTSNDNDGEFGGDGLWVSPAGSGATRGNHGGGGGGGGAGGFDIDNGVFCLFDSGNGIGGGGGGGGAGGCGGEPGGTGQAGGGTFCLVAVNSSIEVTNTDLFLGAGGNGGQGGNGGDGGIPGTPGGGASGTDSGGEPGNGNSGAAGGGGGGGGGGNGGCGGSSVGIVTTGAAEVAVANVSFNGGTSGTPGTGGDGGIRADGVGLAAPAGADGCNGVLADTREYP